jgi:hypothetical protein
MSEESRSTMLVEAMKRLRVIEKRIMANCTDITRYSSMISTERPQFESEEKQRSKVKSLVQANTDLVDEYLKLKKQIEFTNLMTVVEIGGTMYRISDLLVIKRKLAKMMQNTYAAMNTTEADMRMRNVRSPEGQTPTVQRLYSEEDRSKGLRKWQDLYDNIDSRLEVINATTLLLTEIPSN